jgi:steroid delta-isomerase-like uncharacterized protein
VSVEQNKALVRQWVELWNTKNVDAVDQLVAPSYVRHDPNVPEVHGPENQKQFISMVFAAFPDLQLTIHDLFGEEDRVSLRITLKGTQQGEWLGIPPTQKKITLQVLENYRFTEGQIAEQWVVMDALGMLQQLGVIPTPGS